LAFWGVLCHVLAVFVYHCLASSLLISGCQKNLIFVYAIVQNVCRALPLLLVFAAMSCWSMTALHIGAGALILSVYSVGVAIAAAAFGQSTLCSERLDINTIVLLLSSSLLLTFAYILLIVCWNKRLKKRARSRDIDSSSTISFDDEEPGFDASQYVRVVSAFAFLLSCLEAINIASDRIARRDFTVLLIAEVCLDSGQGIAVFLSLAHLDDVKNLMTDFLEGAGGTYNMLGTFYVQLGRRASLGFTPRPSN